MTGCIHPPTSLGDFLAVIEGCAIAAGGSDWRTPFTYGLAAVLVVGLFLTVGWLALRAAR